MTARRDTVPSAQTNRREFLRYGSLGGVAAAMDLAGGRLARASARRDCKCLLLFLVGGPSHLETFDPKPDAPSNVRGPFGSIATNVAGIRISENLPQLARRADQYALVRSLFHHAPPIHETGQQLVQTGHLCRPGEEHPHMSAVHAKETGLARRPVLLPYAITNTGVSVSHGQTAATLGAQLDPGVPWPTAVDPMTMVDYQLRHERDGTRDRYGRTLFGQSCLLARKKLEGDSRFITVNACDTVYDKVTWDCHADGGSLGSTLEDYKTILCPTLDMALSATLDDLRQSGQLDSTLVVAIGEFGRTPYLNHRGGRDHWTRCWSALFAGAGVRGGQVIGASDAEGAEPKDRPVCASEVAATILAALGCAEGSVPAEPMGELFS